MKNDQFTRCNEGTFNGIPLPTGPVTIATATGDALDAIAFAAFAMPRRQGEPDASLRERLIGHINGVAYYEDPSLDGDEMVPVTIAKPRDPSTTCQCGASKAHHERVCGACFVAPASAAAHVPERETVDVERVRCPSCGNVGQHSARVGCEASAHLLAWRNAQIGEWDFADCADDRGVSFGPLRLVALRCGSCSYEWTPPEHLRHNWVRP